MASFAQKKMLATTTISGELVLDVEFSNKRRGSRAILCHPVGSSNQIFIHDETNRIVPQHCTGLVLDVSGESKEAGAKLIFWKPKKPVAANQQFYLDDDNFLCSYGTNMVGGCLTCVVGESLVMVPRDSSMVLSWHWTALPQLENGGSGANAPNMKSSQTNSANNRNKETTPGQAKAKAETENESNCIPEAVLIVMKAQNYYEVLGLSNNNLDDVMVRRAYLKGSVKVHPDKHPAFQTEATQAFQQISAAYDSLKDDEGRHSYAAKMRRGNQDPQRGPPNAENDSMYNSRDGWWSRSNNGVSAAQAAALFAAAFAAEMATEHIQAPRGVSKALDTVLTGAELVATLHVAEQLIQGGGGNKLAAGLMVAQVGGRLASAAGASGKLGTLLRVGGTIATIGRVALAANDAVRLQNGGGSSATRRQVNKNYPSE